MSMLDSFFSKGFKAAKCKTLLKLSIPRIKLLRNRREIQIKQMRREIAKLLETGQEATARIRVEHIIREEKMMAAQEIIELFCELITVRLPIIDTQRECPLDLKEAISSVCFAAPRCADLPELLQVQLMFVGKYGKEFVSAATELMPECGVNRQLVELLSIRAPAPDVKLKLLKEIAEEHELDWDPAESEIELLKPHEDLLNGPTQFVSGSKLPLPKERHDEPLHSTPELGPDEQSDSDTEFDSLDFPEVPKASLRPSVGTVSAPEMLPFPLPPLYEVKHEPEESSGTIESSSHEPHSAPEEILEKKSVANEIESPNSSEGAVKDKQLEKKSVANEIEPPNSPAGPVKDKQFVPFISPPALSSSSFSVRRSDPPPSLSRTKSEVTKSEVNVDLNDVLAAAQAAAESAERAAAAARSAASLAQLRISEIVKKREDRFANNVTENPFHGDSCHSPETGKPSLDHQNSLGITQLRISEIVKKREDRFANNVTENPFHGDSCHSPETGKPSLDHQNSLGNSDAVFYSPSPRRDHENRAEEHFNPPSYDDPKLEYDSPLSSNHVLGHNAHQPQRLPSMNDESLFSYPNLFRSQDSDLGSGVHPFPDNSRSTNEV